MREVGNHRRGAFWGQYWVFCYSLSGVYSVHKVSVPTFRVTLKEPHDPSGALSTHADKGPEYANGGGVKMHLLISASGAVSGRHAMNAANGVE
jgi:hypothetical protein